MRRPDSRGPRRHPRECAAQRDVPGRHGRDGLVTAGDGDDDERNGDHHAQSQDERTPAAGHDRGRGSRTPGRSGHVDSGEGRVERRDEARRVGEPVGRTLREAALEHGVDGWRQLGPAFARGRHGRVDVREQDRGVGAARERHVAGQQLVAHRGQRVAVARGCGATAAHQFRRQVGQRAEDRARPRSGRRHLAVTREPEVREQHATIPHKDVGRLDVAVHDARRVRVVERPRHRAQDRERISGRARDELHRQPRAVRRVASVSTHGGDRGMGEPGLALAPRRKRALSAGSPTFNATAPSADVASNTTAVAPCPSTRCTRYPPMIVPVAMATLTGAVTGRA